MFYVVQAGTSLQVVQPDGTITTLTLPTGVTIDSTRRMRMAVLGQHIAMVNAGTVNLWLDSLDLSLRTMNLLPPINPPTLAAGPGTGPTGAYRAKVSFAVKDINGEIINESPLSFQSNSVTVTAQDLEYSNLPLSPNSAVNCRRIYRTAAGGTVFFPAFDIDDNEQTSALNGIPDAALEDLPENPDRGNPIGTVPGTRMRLIIEWKNRLWGVPDTFDLKDHLFYTADGLFFAWPAANDFIGYPEGEDEYGIVGLLARKDALGVVKRGRLLKLIGSTDEDFEMVTVADKVGGIAPDACIVVRDKGYCLGEDGFYRWDDDGYNCVSRQNVDPWFTTDTYFNRAQFPNAVAAWNPANNTIELALAAAGSSNLDRWIALDLATGEWLGPHSTAAFTPTTRALLKSNGNALLPAVGASDGHIYLQNQSGGSDVSSAPFAVSAALETRWHAGKGSPDADHYFGQLSVLSRIESGGTLTATPYVGRFAAAAQASISIDLTAGRERLRRMGVGALCKLRFTQATVGRQFLLYGYEIKPIHEVGIR